MSDFDQIKALLAPQCPQLTAHELDELVYDVFVAIAWATRVTKAVGMDELAWRPTPPPCEQLCQ